MTSSHLHETADTLQNLLLPDIVIGGASRHLRIALMHMHAPIYARNAHDARATPRLGFRCVDMV
jgi:hypothetical protein